MSAARNATKIDENELASLCAEIVLRIKTQEDPVSLNSFRALVRKNVPFFMRSYFSAFLLKQLYEAVPDRGRKGREDRKRRTEPRPEDRSEPRSTPKPERSAGAEPSVKKEDVPRRSLPEDEAATLFIGIGRNRRAYARDLFAFLTADGACVADDVGELRILDNFSFAQVRKETADVVIEKLNGKEYRGRAVSVSYAKPRKDESKEPLSQPSDEPTARDDPEE